MGLVLILEGPGELEEKNNGVCGSARLQSLCFQLSISGALYTRLCKDLAENQFMDSSLIGLGQV